MAMVENTEPRILEDMSAKLEQIAEDAQFSPTEKVDVSKRVIEATFSFKKKKGDKVRYKKTVRFDFSGCSEEELLSMALYEAKQKVQNQLRAISSEEEMLATKTLHYVDVKTAIIDTEKRTGAGKEFAELVKSAKAMGVKPDELRAFLEARAASKGGAASDEEGDEDEAPEAPKAPQQPAKGGRGRKAA